MEAWGSLIRAIWRIGLDYSIGNGGRQEKECSVTHASIQPVRIENVAADEMRIDRAQIDIWRSPLVL